MADKDIKIIIQTLLESDKFKKGIQSMNTQAKNSTKIMGALKNALAGISVAFVAAKLIQGFKAAIKVGMEFEQAIANVSSVSGSAKMELESLAREAGKNTVFSARQAADAMYFLASAGLDAKDMAEVLNPTLNLAAAAQMDIASATDLVVNQLKTFRAEMKDAEKYTDIMAKTVSSSNTNMIQLGDALSYAGSIAAQNGISFEDLNAIIGTMADQGIKGARAGTQIRMALTRLIKPTSEAQAVLAKYGITQEQVNNLLNDPVELFKLLKPVTENAADATALFGVRQQNVIGIIKNGIPQLEALRVKIDDAGGAAKNMADVQINTLEGQLKLLKSAFEEVILQLTGDSGFNTLLKDGVVILKNIVLGISSFLAGLQAFKNSVAGIRLMATGLLLVRTAVNALVASFGVFGRTVVGVGKNVFTTFKGIGKVLADVVAGDFTKAKEDASATLAELGQNTVKIVTGLKDPFINIKNDVVDFYNTWKNASNETIDENVIKNLEAMASNDALTDNLKKNTDERVKLTDKEMQARNSLANIYTDTLSGTADALSDFNATAKDKLKDILLATFSAIAGEIRARGIALIAASIFPPNPAGFAAGSGMILASGVIKGIGNTIVGSFKDGTERTRAGLAMIHDDERILPASMNVPGVSNEAFAAAAMQGLGFGGSAGTSINNYTTSTSNDNTKKVYNFYGIRDISAARNQLLRSEGQGAF
jgi:TP901 family phage tail tape measure protein